MIYILICTALTGLISLTGIYRNKKKPQSKSKRVNKIFAAASMAVFIPYMATAVLACVHGADPESLQRFGILRTVQAAAFVRNGGFLYRLDRPDRTHFPDRHILQE